MTSRSLWLVGAVLASAGIAGTGCASVGPGSTGFGRAPEAVEAGDVITFEDAAFKILKVDTDFVVLRRVDSSGRPGEITGFVREVLRVSRYDLGVGRWYEHETMPGAYLQWCGGDSFTIARDRAALGGALVAKLPAKVRESV